jgi:hypothetical protein
MPSMMLEDSAPLAKSSAFFAREIDLLFALFSGAQRNERPDDSTLLIVGENN